MNNLDKQSLNMLSSLLNNKKIDSNTRNKLLSQLTNSSNNNTNNNNEKIKNPQDMTPDERKKHNDELRAKLRNKKNVMKTSRTSKAVLDKKLKSTINNSSVFNTELMNNLNLTEENKDNKDNKEKEKNEYIISEERQILNERTIKLGSILSRYYEKVILHNKDKYKRIETTSNSEIVHIIQNKNGGNNIYILDEDENNNMYNNIRINYEYKEMIVIGNIKLEILRDIMKEFELNILEVIFIKKKDKEIKMIMDEVYSKINFKIEILRITGFLYTSEILGENDNIKKIHYYDVDEYINVKKMREFVKKYDKKIVITESSEKDKQGYMNDDEEIKYKNNEMKDI